MAKVRHRMRRALRDWVRLCLPQRQAGLIPQSLIILRPWKAHPDAKKRPPGILPGGRRDHSVGQTMMAIRMYSLQQHHLPGLDKLPGPHAVEVHARGDMTAMIAGPVPLHRPIARASMFLHELAYQPT